MTGKNDKQLYVERRPQGDYAVRRPGSERASAVERPRARPSRKPGNWSHNQRQWWSGFAIPRLATPISGAHPDGH